MRVQQHQAAGNGKGAEESQLNPTIALAPQFVLTNMVSHLGHSVGDDWPYPWTIQVWFHFLPGFSCTTSPARPWDTSLGVFFFGDLVWAIYLRRNVM